MSVLALLLALVFSCSASNAQTVTVIVNKSGFGNFTTVQQAIDWVPVNNNQWIRIRVKAGIYTFQFTYVEEGCFGPGSNNSNRVKWMKTLNQIELAPLNTYNKLILCDEDAVPNARVEQAPAVMLWGDKASFYACGFVSLQDTLANMQGRHYFSQCYIESAVDFIWGYCQSIYEGCAINSKDAIVGGNPGYITAHGRLSPNDSRGFVFEQCTVNGDDTTFLGRAYRAYSRVVFSESELGGDVLPQGWDAWRGEGHEHTHFDIFLYRVGECVGIRSHMRRRAASDRELTSRIGSSGWKRWIRQN
ncbi:hypothetical protein CRG98_004442 [Punica granatum]|uniref:pectinesterase n=1 Tax=Punica granatum TaxID=22663 RepID=A0A2I0L319_PUNGR|nr:hypothetical protein CRG98_004442 [Punica granatum]